MKKSKCLIVFIIITTILFILAFFSTIKNNGKGECIICNFTIKYPLVYDFYNELSMNLDNNILKEKIINCKEQADRMASMLLGLSTLFIAYIAILMPRLNSAFDEKHANFKQAIENYNNVGNRQNILNKLFKSKKQKELDIQQGVKYSEDIIKNERVIKTVNELQNTLHNISILLIFIFIEYYLFNIFYYQTHCNYILNEIAKMR